MSIKAIRPATLIKVVTYLEDELGLSVYGAYRDLDNAIEFPNCMDYNVKQIVKLRKLLLKGVEFTQEDF